VLTGNDNRSGASGWSRREGLDLLAAAYLEATRSVGRVERTYAIGARIVRVEAAGEPALKIVDPGLAHLAAPGGGSPELVVQVWDSASSGVHVPGLPSAMSGEAAPADEVLSAYHAVPQILTVYERAQRRAVVWVPDASRVPSNELASPLRTLLHWWSRDHGLQFIHGGAVALGGRGVLLAGPSGAGKSTAALACLMAGLDYLGDDYVLVESRDVPVVHSLYNAGKVQPSHLATFPSLGPLIENGHELPAEKPLWFFQRWLPGQMVASARALAVFVPEVTGNAATSIVPIRASTALAALAPSTIVQLSRADQTSLSAIAAFVAQVPSYRLRSGTDLTAIARTVREFIAGGRLS
jgi:hypothetical protein